MKAKTEYNYLQRDNKTSISYLASLVYNRCKFDVSLAVSPDEFHVTAVCCKSHYLQVSRIILALGKRAVCGKRYVSAVT